MKIKTPIRYSKRSDAFWDANDNVFTNDEVADALNTAAAREARLVKALEQIPNDVPTNWLDPLLTGDKAVIHTSDVREIEALLRGIQDRLRTSVATTLADIKPQDRGEK